MISDRGIWDVNKGGGWLVYHLNVKDVGNMTTADDNIMEMIRVETINEKDKNYIIGCVCRSPGSCVETFTK